MWDSFEAIFFVVAGFSVGLVLGVLFPSIWRSFRRSFRKKSHYAPPAEKWDENLKSKIKILPEENESSEEEESGVFYIHVFEAFTAARYYFQMGDTRKAVSLYIEILTSEQVSKQDTNRALYELSQVYSHTGLYDRAFDTAFELLNRKPHQSQVLLHLLKICAQNFVPDKLNLALNTYKGIPEAGLRRFISHSVCKISTAFLEKKEMAKAIDYARLAVKWDRTSGRALILLWETTSRQFWQKNIHDKKINWLSFAADLEARNQISLSSKISPAAGAEYLSTLIEHLYNLPNCIENYKEVEKEFKATFNWDKFPMQTQKKLLESILYAVLLLQKKNNLTSLYTERKFVEIISLIVNNQQDKILGFLNYNKKHESYLFLGILAHQCSQCQTLSPNFTWQCANCGLEESLFPVNSIQELRE